jgi:cell wall-associated NlpC family hydrolase
MADEKPYIGFNNSGIINLDSNNTGVKMLDKLSRLQDERRIKPLDQYDNVMYPHRYLYDSYNLLIGDTYFMIPPEFIAVTSEATSQSIVTLRQENTQKMKAGYHKRTIMIDLVFNGIEQLNGYPVEGPEGTYYVDGLRQLLAQFKCTPFLPISNELINGMYGIFTVALQSITMYTIQGYPNAMGANITLQEVNMFPYIQMPDVSFKYMIDWDLFRFYYQRMLTENHTYKKLQSLPANKEHNRFKLSILDESVFSSEKATKYNLLQIICDKKIVKTKEDGSLDSTNYTTWVDSDTDNVTISSFQCNYANILTNIQLSDSGSPTIQYMGGMDTIYNITFETTDYTVVQSLEQCQLTNDILTRGNRKLSSLGFVRLESELVEFTGSLFVMIETVMTNTVPGFPGLYNVQMQCVAYDIAQSEREDLNGFMPFECKEEGRCGEYVPGEGFVSDHAHTKQAIEQSMDGLLVKIKQDAYAEWKLRTSIEVYPDLRLPTYDEVDEVITKIRNFREKYGLSQLEYTKYPKSTTCMLHGLPLDNDTSFRFDNISGTIIDVTTIDDSLNQYDVFVDPDFYVFYPSSYESFMEEDEDAYSSYTPTARETQVRDKTIIRTPNYDGTGQSNPDLIEQFIALAKTFIGHTYKWGAEGEISDAKGKCFDCSGFVTYLLKEIGVMPTSKSRFTVATMPGDDLFTEIPWSQMQRGDILCNSELTHVVIYEGDNQIIHAANSSPYPKGGVKEGTLYFTGGRCLRPKQFGNSTESTGTNSISTDTSSEDVSAEIWGILKSYGLSDIAASAILGNAKAESNVNPSNLQNTYENKLGYSDDSYTAVVDSGAYDNFIHDKAGYGLFQFTYWSLKQDLYNEAKARGVSISDTKLQVDIMIAQIKQSGVFDMLNSALSVKEASNIFLHKYERPADQSTKVENKRAEYSQSFYDKFKGTGGSNPSDGSVASLLGFETLTHDEFESICRVVMAETKGETSEAEKAMAQVIYDRLTHPSKKFGGLSNILNSGDQFQAPYQGELNSTVESNVRAVFCSNDKYWPESKVWYFLTPEDTNASFKDREDKYDRIGEVGLHVYWGEESEGSDTKYIITNDKGTGDASSNIFSFLEKIIHEAVTIKAVKKFGQPVYVKTHSIMYDNNWTPWGNNEGRIATNELNSTENTFNTAFCDEVQYSGRGKLVRAFPTYLFCILDDQCQWYDGKKLWTNYYVHRSVVDIAVHATNDMPTETATITITNSYHNLDRIQGGLSSYNITEDDGYNGFQQWWYSWTHMMPGFGPKLTKKLIELHQVICNQALLREGARIHLRMGYGSDPLSLAPVMNGHISDIMLGDQITMVVTSDGSELIQHIVSSSKNDTNNGWLGLFGLGESQESSNIIANTLCARQSWVTHLMGSTFEGSKYSIEHFGLYFNKTVMRVIGEYVFESTGDGASLGENIGKTIGELIGLNLPFISDVTGFIGAGVGNIIGAVAGFQFGLVEGVKDITTDLWDGNQENYDILKNIYKANYKREHYIYTTSILGMDAEQNVVFNKYNMTPWDMFQVCTQQVPEYIVKPSYHQFDSRLYFGLPGWMEKYRYDYINGVVYEECKTAAQVHFIESMDCIIDNQVKVTSKFSNTNVKVMYTRGSEAVSTKVIHSDDSIDFAKQKTSILDSPIVQDALGPDMIYEFLGYNVGEESARRVGISNLLYGWQQQYQGQLLLMGHPGLKPHDYMMINDTFASLYGIAIAREVIHSFNTNTGFTTSVVPGMVGFSTDENSGLIQTTQNYLMVLNCFSSYTQLRKNLRNNYEKNIAVAADMELMRDKLMTSVRRQANWNNVDDFRLLIGDIGSIITVAKAGKDIYKFTTKLYDMVKTGEAVKTFMGAFSSVMKAGKGIKATLTAIKAGTIATGTAAGGVPGLVMAVIWIAVDILLSEFFEWLSNQNVCVLLPLWWEGYPFVAGTKDGEKILLMDSNSNSTDENTREDRHEFE